VDQAGASEQARSTRRVTRLALAQARHDHCLAEDVRELIQRRGIHRRTSGNQMGHPPRSADEGEREAESAGPGTPGSCAQSIDSERYCIPQTMGTRVAASFLIQPRLAAVENKAGRSHGRAARASMQPFLRSKMLLILKISHALKVQVQVQVQVQFPVSNLAQGLELGSGRGVPNPALGTDT
jgi:hypothetical protein